MNICLIASQYAPSIIGGVGSTCYRISKNLACLNVNVHVVIPGLPSSTRPITVSWEEGVTVHRAFRGIRRELELWKIGNYIRTLNQEVNFDLIHCLSLWPCGLVGALVSKEISKSFIINVDSSIETMRYNPNLLGTMRWILEQASSVVTTNTSLLNDSLCFAKIQNGRRILNAFDASMFASRSLLEFAKELGGKSMLIAEKFRQAKLRGGPVIGTIGGMHPAKGFAILMEAFRDLVTVCPTAHLLLVGDLYDNNEKKQWLNWIKKKSLKGKVTFTGFIPHRQILSWVREMDIFVQPSLIGASGNALLEAMSCGLPIVASDIGGVQELVSDKKDGFLIKPDCVDSLLQKLKILSQDQSLRRSLGDSAKRTASSARFFPEREANEWMALYKKVTQNGSCRT